LNGDGAPAVEYKRYRNTPDGIPPRALPGTRGYAHVVATDEHDEDGVLISDEFTDPHKRQAMMERRLRKMESALTRLRAPQIEGPSNAQVTLVGWGSTYGVIAEAAEHLREEGVSANHLHVKWMVPLHAEAIVSALSKSRKVVIVENNQSGQFARYLRSETGVVADGQIRKYDGEPFWPHHIVEGIQQILAGRTKKYVPVHEIRV
jgi:2-oxoglutarate ferredoxin oxidoreductase subunit alpha